MWEALETAYIIGTCKGFCSRVEAVIAADGGYIELAAGEGMWFVVPSHCFNLLLNMCESAEYLCEKSKSAKTFRQWRRQTFKTS